MIRNPIAKAVKRIPHLIVKAKKGKGSYGRKNNIPRSRLSTSKDGL